MIGRTQNLPANWRNWPEDERRALLERIKELKKQGDEILFAPENEPDPDHKGRMVWPSGHVVDKLGQPAPFHRGQQLAHDAITRIVAIFAGTQGGKTKYGPWWMDGEIDRMGRGDYLAVTSTYTLFDNNMLPSLLHVFVSILGKGRYWGGNTRIIEIRDPETGEFWAKHSKDEMYARIILRSSEQSGLEAFTAKAVWIDEAGQDKFPVSYLLTKSTKPDQGWANLDTKGISNNNYAIGIR